MKNLIKLKLSTGLAVMCMTWSITCLSCKHEDVQPTKILFTSDVKVELLKQYLSQLTGVDTAEIKYEVTTQKFFINGVDQLNKTSLQKFYENNGVIRYKDGAPVLK